jgi:outer membrane protein assembly factor BamB
MLGGGVDHTALTNFSWDPAAPGAWIRWKVPVGGRVFSTPAVGADGTIYFGTDHVNETTGYADGGFVYAVDAAGNLLWTADVQGAVQQTTPALDARGVLYVSALGGAMFALNATTGETIWVFQTNGGAFFATTPIVAPDGSVVVSSPAGAVHALFPNSTVRWTHGGPILPNSTVRVWCGAFIGLFLAHSSPFLPRSSLCR